MLALDTPLAPHWTFFGSYVWEGGGQYTITFEELTSPLNNLAIYNLIFGHKGNICISGLDKKKSLKPKDNETNNTKFD
jgi:hypothetical protein